MVSVRSFDARLAICNNLMQRRRRLKVFQGWEALYNKLGRKYAKRSELAHGTVVQLNDETVLIPYYTMGQGLKRYVGKDAEDIEPLRGLSAKEIKERGDGFRALAGSVGQFALNLIAELQQLQASREPKADPDPQPEQSDRSPTEQ